MNYEKPIGRARGAVCLVYGGVHMDSLVRGLRGVRDKVRQDSVFLGGQCLMVTLRVRVRRQAASYQPR